jgi:hypothetical protein
MKFIFLVLLLCLMVFAQETATTVEDAIVDPSVPATETTPPLGPDEFKSLSDAFAKLVNTGNEAPEMKILMGMVQHQDFMF